MPPAGSVLDERTKISLKWVGGILVVLVPLVAIGAVARHQVEANTVVVEKHTGKLDEHERRIQRLEDEQRHVREGIDELLRLARERSK